MHKIFIDSLIKKSDIKANTKEIKKSSKYSYKEIKEPSFSSYIVLDFETTGFLANKDKIIEIGAIKVKDNKIIDEFESLINPLVLIPENITQITNITNQMVKDKPTIKEIIKDFLNFIGDENLVIHNASFDMKFLIENATKHKYKINNKALDTVKACKALYPEIKKYNLANLCEVFEINRIGSHRAIQDAKATYELYKILYNKLNTYNF